MKQIFFIIAACLTGINAYSYISEMKTVKLNDGEETQLLSPSGERLVVA
jgi:hypothetical protein